MTTEEFRFHRILGSQMVLEDSIERAIHLFAHDSGCRVTSITLNRNQQKLEVKTELEFPSDFGDERNGA